MKAEETTLRLIIETTKQFVIPLFQRFYVWDKKYWDILWNDLLKTALDKNKQHTHFLGSLVFIPDENVSLNLTRFIVIDGQQRMTTLLILLTVIKNLAKLKEENLSNEIRNTMLSNPYKEGDDYYKLLLSDKDRDAFQIILDSADSKNHVQNHQLSQCYKYFEDRISESENLSLKVLFETIADRLSLVTITLATHENPYLVFESLNFKGHKLTEADLIRNYLFMRVPTKKQQAIYAKYWKPMEENLGSNITEYVRHYLMRSGAIVKQTEVYLTLKNRLGQSDVIESIKDLFFFSDYYEKILHPQKEKNEKIRESLSRLNRLDTTTVYPFLLNCYRDYNKNHLKENEFSDVISVIENYLIRRFICKRPSSELNKIFAPIYNQVYKSSIENFVEAFKIILQNKGYPNNIRFSSDLMTRKLYGRGDREKKTRFLLETLELSYKHKEPVDFEDLTIEHIMPQKITDWWKDHLGENWEEIHESNLHLIGNLTLTGYNSELSNGTFLNKRQDFLNSHLVLNSYFNDVNSWREEDIKYRAQKLTDQALLCWPYFGDSSLSEKSLEDVSGTKPEKVIVLKEEFEVKSWREVLQYTLSTLLYKSPDSFYQLANNYPNYIAKSPQGFRAPKLLSESNYYIETNLGSASINRFCRRAVEKLGYSPTDWEVIYLQPTNTNIER